MTDFPTFWQSYPRRVGKLDAMKAWNVAIKTYKPEDIIAGIQPYIDNKPDHVDYCHPATFIRQGRWMDEYENTSRQTPMREVTEAEFRVKLREEGSRFADAAEIPRFYWSSGRYMVPDDWKPELKEVI